MMYDSNHYKIHYIHCIHYKIPKSLICWFSSYCWAEHIQSKCFLKGSLYVTKLVWRRESTCCWQ